MNELKNISVYLETRAYLILNLYVLLRETSNIYDLWQITPRDPFQLIKGLQLCIVVYDNLPQKFKLQMQSFGISIFCADKIYSPIKTKMDMHGRQTELLTGGSDKSSPPKNEHKRGVNFYMDPGR